MNNDLKLFNDGLEKYPISIVLIENIVLSLWILIGSFLITQFNLLLGLVYISCALIMILFVMRKLICTSCYYYGKTCHVGWGKLASFLYKQGQIEEFSTCIGQKIAPIFFALLALIPLIFGLILIVNDFSIFNIVLFILLLCAILYSSVFARKKSCEKCKMKNVCAGSAAK